MADKVSVTITTKLVVLVLVSLAMISIFTTRISKTPFLSHGFGKVQRPRSPSTFLRQFHQIKGNILGSNGYPLESKRNLRAFSTQNGDPFYITTPIYYVNDKPHIGHAYTTVACDILARYRRLKGDDVLFVTGTDEHGQKVQQSAEKASKSPQEFVDEVSQDFRDLATELLCSQDIFIRTTEERHKAAATALWKMLEDNGQIYLGHYQGWYSVRDETYYKESELIDGKAPTGAEVEWVVKEPSYFFKLSEWTQPLLEFYERNPGFIQPEIRKAEVENFVKKGLQDLSISRTTFDWGVPVPGDEDKKHVMYVWVDALTNYLTATGFPWTGGEKSKFWPPSVHVMGKDILRFHAIYWPAMLLAAGIEPPKSVFAHGWWMRDGQKMSKSIGNVIDPRSLISQFGVDQTRYFLASSVSFGDDGDYNEESMLTACNGVLANGLGNLAQRSLSLVFKNCDKRLPDPPAPEQLTEKDKLLIEASKGLLDTSDKFMSANQIHKYCNNIHFFVKDANVYIDNEAPWSLKKTDPERMKVVLWVVLEVVRRVSILLQPVMPKAMAHMLDQLGVAVERRDFASLDGSELLASEIAKPVPVFPRVELPESSTA